MGTVLLHFTGPKIAQFFCDSNISRIWGREEIGKIKMFQIFFNWQSAALRFCSNIAELPAWRREGKLGDALTIYFWAALED